MVLHKYDVIMMSLSLYDIISPQKPYKTFERTKINTQVHQMLKR